MPSLGVIGSDGRLGSRIVHAVAQVGAAVSLRGVRDGWTGDVPDVLIDVSTAEAFAEVVGYCRKHAIPLLSAVSGLTDDRRDELGDLSTQVPVLRADNLSLGNYLQRMLADALGPAIPAGTVRVIDRHPLYKKDIPSATAQALRDRLLAGALGSLTIGIDSIRAGMPVCEHDIRLNLGDEELVITHAVRDWSAYSLIAVRAAIWLTGQEPGLYSMDDFHANILAKE